MIKIKNIKKIKCIYFSVLMKININIRINIVTSLIKKKVSETYFFIYICVPF